MSFPFSFSPVFRTEQRSISIRTQEKWQVTGFSLGCNVDIGLRNFVCLTFYAGPSHRLAIVTAAENHFRAANDNHDIANRRIPITPDLDFRRRVFAGHRKISLCSKAVSISPSPDKETAARNRLSPGRRLTCESAYPWAGMELASLPETDVNLIFLDRGCLDKDTNSNEATAVSRITQNDQIGLFEPE
jgi:hypothetical protein